MNRQFQRRNFDDARIAEELAEVGPKRCGGRRVGSAELNEQNAKHARWIQRGESESGESECSERTVRCRIRRLVEFRPRRSLPFFLQSGPSLASCFSVMWPSPAALSAADFVGVQRRVARPLRRHVGLGEDRLDRAFRHARLAVDAVDRVDVQHHVVLVEALDRADGHAIGVLAVVARFANGVRHDSHPFPARPWKRNKTHPRVDGFDRFISL